VSSGAAVRIPAMHDQRTTRAAPGSDDAALVRTAEFRTALRRFLNSSAAAAARAGLTPQRYDVLLMIKAAMVSGDIVTVSSLCTSLDLRQPAVTELVQRVEQAGLVRRTRSQADGRVFLLSLTEDGERRLLRVFAELSEDRSALSEAFAQLGESFHASGNSD
jgi:DNA-binding MarR family transcriptional regulator